MYRTTVFPQVLLLISLNMVTPDIHFSRNCQTEVMFRSYICRGRYFSGHQMLHSFFNPWETRSRLLLLYCFTDAKVVVCFMTQILPTCCHVSLLASRFCWQTQHHLDTLIWNWHHTASVFVVFQLLVCTLGRMLAHVCVCELPLPPCILNHRAPPPYQHVVLSLPTWCTWHVSLDIVH